MDRKIKEAEKRSHSGMGKYKSAKEEAQAKRNRVHVPEEEMQEQLLRVVYELGSGLAYVHSKGIVHADVKPDNILMTGGRAAPPAGEADEGANKSCAASIIRESHNATTQHVLWDISL